MELLDYAHSLEEKDRELAEKAAAVFLLFYRQEYGSIPPDAADAEYTLELLREIQKRLELLRSGAL